MRLVDVDRTVKLEADTVYLVPPRRGARAIDGTLLLTDGAAGNGGMVIDLFLRSLADTHGAHAAAVLLSGPGGDGTIGIKRIKERGGLTIAQDPDEAAQDRMPRAAIGTGMVDWILPAREMPHRLVWYFDLEPQLKLPQEEGTDLRELSREAQAGDAHLRDILTLLRTRTGRDFAHYKRATILRRIGAACRSTASTRCRSTWTACGRARASPPRCCRTCAPARTTCGRCSTCRGWAS